MMEDIQSLQNPRLKRAVRLRSARGRSQQDRFIIDGIRELQRALDAGVPLVEVFCCAPVLREEGKQLLDELRQRNVECLNVTQPVFEKLAFGDRLEGLVGVADRWRRTLDDCPTGGCPLYAVLDGVEKPGNLGAVLRSGRAAGIDGVLLTGTQCDELNPNAIRASQGASFMLPVVQTDVETAQRWLRAHQIRILVTRVDASHPYTEAPLNQPAAIVLGSEDRGVSSAWQNPEFEAIQVPMSGGIDSLNVAATATLLFFEARRQRELL